MSVPTFLSLQDRLDGCPFPYFYLLLNADAPFSLFQFSSYWDDLFTCGFLPLLLLVFFNLQMILKIRASNKFGNYRFVGGGGGSSRRGVHSMRMTSTRLTSTVDSPNARRTKSLHHCNGLRAQQQPGNAVVVVKSDVSRISN